MKRKTLQSKNVMHVFTLLLVFLFGLSPFFIQAQQPQEYRSDKDVLVGTSNTRLMSSIYETETTVTMKIMAVGYMKADNISFSVFYDPTKLVFCEENLTPITQFGALKSGAAVLNQELVTKQWRFDGLYKDAGTTVTTTEYISGHETMRAILFEVGLPYVSSDKLFVVKAGEVKNVMQFTFAKATNQPLTENDFGLGVKTTGTSTGFYQPEFGHDGLFVWYRDRATSINKRINPNAFLYRSGSGVETSASVLAATTSAKVSGTFWQGAENLPVSTNILDNIGNATTGTAKLSHDIITEYGFIYTIANVNMVIDEFSDSIKINNVNYELPTDTEISDGSFMRDGKTFYIVIVDDNNGLQETLLYDATLVNLIPDQDYYTWAFTRYYFETSNPFQAIGKKVHFKTTSCVALNIESVYIVEEPLCDNNNGKIKMNVTGGSGVYVFSVNGGDYTTYTNNIINNLTAGTYTIAVKDVSQLACDSTVADNVVLHNANTDLNVLLTATNAQTCAGYGTLFVAVTGGSGTYEYLLNGNEPTVVNGWITAPQLPVGEYEMTVKDLDNNCVASSGKVYIYADDSQLAAQVEITNYPACSENTGVIEFTVTGAKDNKFTYQLDGYTAQVEENYDNTPITLSGLSAGVHYLRITDACKQIVEKITIDNEGSNPFAFAADPHNEVLSCNGALLPGSITIELTNGIAPFEYSINGNDWYPLINATISNLNQGTYRVQIRDNATPKCTYEVNNVTIGREIYTPINIATVFTSKEPECEASNGEIQVFVTGGSNLYLYTVNGVGPKHYPNGLIKDLTAGIYTIIVQDSLFKSCPSVTIDNIVLHNINTDLDVVITPTHAQTCSETGALFVTVTGGTGNYSYLLNGTVPNIVNGWIQNLPVNEYELTVEDNGCVASSGKVRITAEQHNLIVTGDVTQHATCGSSTGVYTFTVTSSNSHEYTYQLNGYPAQTGSGSNPVTLNGLSAGVHYLRVADYCAEVVKEITITNGDENAFAFTPTAKDEVLTCSGVLELGSITLAINSGISPFQYSINGSDWKPLIGNTIPSLHQGVYRVQLKDDKDCSYEVNQITIGREIHTPISIGTVLAYQDPTCALANGKIQVFATGGSGSYLYSTNGDDFDPYTDGIITGLAAGTYTIWVRDANDNTCNDASISNVTLHNVNTDLSIIVEVENALTCSTDGKLYISATGGSGNYNFYINDLNSSPVGSILTKPVGVYTIYVKDISNGCVASSGEVRITADQHNLIVEGSVTEHTTCGSSTGVYTFAVTSSNYNEYTYQLDGYPAQTGSGDAPIVLSGLSAGVHYLKVSDDCAEIVKEIIITNGDGSTFAFTPTANDEVLTCSGALELGSITLAITGGTSPFRYSINGSEWKPLSGTTIPNLHQGVYRVQLKDATDCTYEVNQVTIGREIHTTISIGTILTSQEPTCNNANGTIHVFAQGGSGSYLYSINGEDFEPYTDGIITGLEAGTYTIWVSDANDNTCDATYIRNIVLHNADTDLSVSVETEDAATCDNTSNGKLIITTTGGSGNYTYYVNEIDGTPVPLTDGYILKPAGTYVVYVVDDEGGCVASSGEARINATSSNLSVSVQLSAVATCGASTGAVNVAVYGASVYTYQLDGNPEVTRSGISFSLTGLSAGKHYLRVTDNCKEIVTTFDIPSGVTNPFTVTANSQKELLNCDGKLIPGSITLNVNNGVPTFEYRLDGGEWIEFTTDGRTEKIENLRSGVYLVEVRDADRCTFEINRVTILRGTSFDSNIIAPVATSPQTFCSAATVENLQATGANIKWYATAEGGYPLAETTTLLNDSIYYAVQSIGFCQSQIRTAVKVHIDPFAVLDTPNIATPQHFCGTSSSLTLADIATDGNTNIVWYDVETNGTALLLTDQLQTKTYYAALEAGNCQASPRLAVQVFIDQTVPVAPVIKDVQHFCDGALIANIVVPNNQIVWYMDETDDTPLAATYRLEDGADYYAAQKAGDCESATRTKVTIYLDAPEAPEAPATQFICKKQTLADLTVTGYGIVWYDTQIGGTQLELTEILVAGKTYWVAQSSGDCVGERGGVTISNACYVVYGTVFPFVHWNNIDIDTLFNITVSLYRVPITSGDPVDAILDSAYVHSVTATFYDGTIHIPGTPKFPGSMGSASNPGKKISWEKLGKEIGTVSEEVVASGEEPEGIIGMYTFENVVPGEYILQVSRAGFLTRWGKVNINEDGMSLGHREIIAGEFNEDFSIRLSDISILNANIAEFEHEYYNAMYDVDGSLGIDAGDIEILLFNLGSFITIYLETEEWINGK